MDVLLVVLLIIIIFIIFYESGNCNEGFKASNKNSTKNSTKKSSNSNNKSSNKDTLKSNYILELELADTPEKRKIGLMNRKDPLNDYKLNIFGGMLFDYKNMGVRSMWMKDTLIPLDMIFVNEDSEIVGLIENAKPNNTKSLSVEKESRYVIELNAGTISKIGLKVGDKINDEKVIMKQEI